MISRNLTVITKDEALKNLVKTARKNTISKFLLALVIMAMGIVIIVAGISANNNLYTGLGIFFVACSIFYFVLASISYKNAPKDILKSNPDLNEGDLNYNFSFKEGYIEVVVVNNIRKNNLRYEYNQVRYVNEYKDRYDIMLKEHLILFVDKNGFTGEKSEEFFKINLEKNKIKFKNKIKEEEK